MEWTECSLNDSEKWFYENKTTFPSKATEDPNSYLWFFGRSLKGNECQLH